MQYNYDSTEDSFKIRRMHGPGISVNAAAILHQLPSAAGLAALHTGRSPKTSGYKRRILGSFTFCSSRMVHGVLGVGPDLPLPGGCRSVAAITHHGSLLLPFLFDIGQLGSA